MFPMKKGISRKFDETFICNNDNIEEKYIPINTV